MTEKGTSPLLSFKSGKVQDFLRLFTWSYFKILIYVVGLSSLSTEFKDLGAVDQLT